MDAIETAIRNALAKGDAGDPQFRERVYLSALQALERSLRANPQTDAEVVARRRKVLRERIRLIETEFQPAAEPEAPAWQPEPSVSARQHGEPAPAPAVELSAPRAEAREMPSDFVSELRVTRPPAEEPDIVADAPVFSRKRRPFAWMLSATVIIAFVAIGLWWLYSSGALVPLAQRDGAVPNPPPSLQSDDFKPAKEGELAADPSATQSGTWLTIFDPSDPTTVTAPSGTTVDVVGEGKAKAVRIAPSAIDSAALFDVGQGILEQVAGKKVVFEINALSESGADTQMSIQCNFAELGDCGRKRYDVEATRNNFLFEMQMPDRSAGSFGSISLTPDIAQGKVPVDVFLIRVFVPEDG